jgi:hypothetical protein
MSIKKHIRERLVKTSQNTVTTKPVPENRRMKEETGVTAD